MVSVALAAPWVLGASGAVAQPKGAPKERPEVRSEQEQEYERHMSVGVRLFRSRDFAAALAEFEAAYAATPKASPLINQALCYRELNRFPKAVTTLELALSKHAQTMTEADKTEAQRAIDDMRSTFAFLTLRVTPEDAQVLIDGEEWAKDARAEKVALTPGQHRIEVSAPGFSAKEEKLRVVSGDEVALDVTLDRATGTLRVVTANKNTPIEIDGRVVGAGVFQGTVPVGKHTVRALGESGVGEVEIAAGGSLTLDLSAGAGATPLPPIPPVDRPKQPGPPEPKRGFYGTVNGAILFPFRHPQFFDQKIDGEFLDGISSGGYVGLRPGYRVHTFAGFEGLLEYGNVQGPANGTLDKSYSLSAVRLGPVLRLMSPGDVIRFVGTLGGGIAIHFISYDGIDPGEVCPGVEGQDCSSVGVDIVTMTEAGFEVDIDRVLIGFSLAFYVSGTKGMNDFQKSASVNALIKEPYDGSLLPMLGPRVHIGYGFW